MAPKWDLALVFDSPTQKVVAFLSRLFKVFDICLCEMQVLVVPVLSKILWNFCQQQSHATVWDYFRFGLAISSTWFSLSREQFASQYSLNIHNLFACLLCAFDTTKLYYIAFSLCSSGLLFCETYQNQFFIMYTRLGKGHLPTQLMHFMHLSLKWALITHISYSHVSL